MRLVSPCTVPDGSLLDAYRRTGSYSDCFVTRVEGTISQAHYVEAFYTTALFKTERLILAWLASAPSTDDQARELALGERDSFAAWHVEARREDQLLMAAGRTRSWLMARPAGTDATRLYFGSAVVPKRSKNGKALGFGFTALLGFHKLYSRALLAAARAKLRNCMQSPP